MHEGSSICLSAFLISSYHLHQVSNVPIENVIQIHHTYSKRSFTQFEVHQFVNKTPTVCKAKLCCSLSLFLFEEEALKREQPRLTGRLNHWAGVGQGFWASVVGEQFWCTCLIANHKEILGQLNKKNQHRFCKYSMRGLQGRNLWKSRFMRCNQKQFEEEGVL